MVRMLGEDYLVSTGWLRSAQAKEAIDADGEPVPWITYPAIEMLKRLVRPDWRVFEYGCGNSTLWWRKRCVTVESVEHDAGYAAAFGAQHAIGDAYVAAPNGPYDVIVIDGEERIACAINAIAHSTPNGIIVFDNSDRDEYSAGYAALTRAGFARIDFSGLGPINPYGWTTSLFVRSLAALV